MTATAEKYPQGYFKEKGCRECGEMFQPQAPSHLYCSQKCADTALERRYLERTYNISLEQYQWFYEKQEGLCAICRQEGFKMHPNQKTSIVVDHCHATGVVRGLLCHNCNRALGLLQDSTDYLKRAIGYLEGATTILDEEYTASDGLWKRTTRKRKTG